MFLGTLLVDDDRNGFHENTRGSRCPGLLFFFFLSFTNGYLAQIMLIEWEVGEREQ